MDTRERLQALNVLDKVQNRKVVIYPFGAIGREVKRILNNEYKIEEFAIVDQNPSGETKGIDFLLSEACNDAVVIIASDSIKHYWKIRQLVKSKFDGNNVIDLFGIVNTTIDPRIEALRLCAHNITDSNVPGAVAEAGVFEGDFAHYINLFFPEKTFYLFDTFEGFDADKLRDNVDPCWDTWMKNNFSFVSSGIESVRKKMLFPEKCRFVKGFFPDTAQDIHEEFCFVNIDMDIYQSTKDGLEYFWPRMVKKGVIFVHDYISWNCPGVKDAVDEFCTDNDLGLMCIPEVNGTAVLIK